MIIIGIFNIKN